MKSVHMSLEIRSIPMWLAYCDNKRCGALLIWLKGETPRAYDEFSWMKSTFFFYLQNHQIDRNQPYKSVSWSTTTNKSILQTDRLSEVLLNILAPANLIPSTHIVHWTNLSLYFTHWNYSNDIFQTTWIITIFISTNLSIVYDNFWKVEFVLIFCYLHQ